MATAKKTPTAKEREAKRIERIERALIAASRWPELAFDEYANDVYAELRAAVYAVVPGRQKARNIDRLLDQATTAVCRVIRRRR